MAASLQELKPSSPSIHRALHLHMALPGELPSPGQYLDSNGLHGLIPREPQPKSYTSAWSSYLPDLLGLRFVGAVKARINVRSSYLQPRFSQLQAQGFYR